MTKEQANLIKTNDNLYVKLIRMKKKVFIKCRVIRIWSNSFSLVTDKDWVIQRHYSVCHIDNPTNILGGIYE